ncbi:MAG: alpha/beta fold hydrolase [Patescibacteria group bacterium]|jgi:carboxylesterase
MENPNPSNSNEEKPTEQNCREKPAVLFLHGFGGKPETVDFLLRYLRVKGYEIYTPILLGHENNYEAINNFFPEDWLAQTEKMLSGIIEKHGRVYLVGASFGGNLCLSLAARYPEKIRGVVTLETPVFFNLWIFLLLKIIQPILELFGVEKVSKNSFFYRKNYVADSHSYEYIPVKTSGKIFDFINQRTKKEVKRIVAPLYILQAGKSDLISKKSARFVYDNVLSRIKRVEYLPLDNHDLDLFDEKEKIITMEKIHEFLSKI